MYTLNFLKKMALIVSLIIIIPAGLTAQETSKNQDKQVNEQILKFTEYPEAALENGEEARLIVKFKTNNSSEIEKVVHRCKEGDKEFYEAAKAALDKFSDSDYSVLLKPNRVYTVPFEFKLD